MWQINRTSLFIGKLIEARNGLQRIQKVNIVGDINTAVPLIPEQARQANLQIMYALQPAYNNRTLLLLCKCHIAWPNACCCRSVGRGTEEAGAPKPFVGSYLEISELIHISPLGYSAQLDLSGLGH